MTEGSHAKSLEIPATDTNQKIFGFAEDINSAVALNQLTKPTARLDIDGTTVIQGFLKPEKPIIDGNRKVIAYVCTLRGDSGDWISLIGDLNLQDLVFDSSQAHTYSKALIDASEVFNLLDSPRGRFDEKERKPQSPFR